MKLSLSDLKVFSFCPIAFCFKQNKSINFITERQKIFSYVVCKSISQITETSFRADWRKIVGWVDEKVFNEVDICDKDQFEAAKRNSEYILTSLSKWYKEVYSEWTTDAFINMTFQVEEFGFVFKEEIPIVSLQENIVITYIDSDPFKTKKEYERDIKIRSLAWLTSKQLKCDVVTVECLSLKKKGNVEINRVHFNKDSLYRTETYIENMCKIIKNRDYYPSIGANCLDCDHYSKCNL